ncbi:MAG: hypothetical protein BGP24_14680 [Lysobacterales bacterium 69-70]|nr:MAG: hypothetical protein BGP24_14680 [Xanthomonadales bacterium 69-70]
MRIPSLLTAALLSLCLALCSACSTTQRLARPDPTRTRTISVPVLQFVPVPAELTAATPAPPRPGATYQAMTDWIVSWAASLQQCNADKAAISNLHAEVKS